MRLQLLTTAAEPAVKLERMALIENTKAGACLEAVFTGEGNGTRGPLPPQARRGDHSDRAARRGRKLHVECPGRFVILPDFFADDIALDAVKLPASLGTVELPSENFVLHPTADGDALGMCVFENRQQDVAGHAEGHGDKRRHHRLGHRL